MTGAERILAAFLHEAVDRVPVFEQSIANSVASELLGRPAYVGTTALHRDQAEAWLRGPAGYAEFEEQVLDDVLAMTELLGLDGVSAPWMLPGPPTTAKLDEFTYVFGEEGGGGNERWYVRRFDPESQTFGVVRRGGGPQDEQGIEREVEGLEKTAAEARPRPEDFVTLRKLQRRAADGVAVMGSAGLAIPLEPVWLEMTALRPDLVGRFLDAAAEMRVRRIECQVSMGLRVMWAGGDLADNRGPIYGPRVFRDLVLPRVRKITKRCTELGAFYLYRTDGRLWSIAEEFFVESGIHGYGEIDVDAGMDLVEVRRRYPGVTLWGGISCGKLLRSGTPGEVRAEVRRVVEGVGRRGLIFGSSNSIIHGTPPENVLAMLDEVRLA